MSRRMISWNRALLEKVIIAYIVKKFAVRGGQL